MEPNQELAATATAAEFRALFDDPSRLRAWLAEALPSGYAFVFARCGANQAVAEDIAQETMVEVVRHRSDFDGRANPVTWVFGLARHKVADHYRAAYREERRRLRVVEGVAEADRGASGTQEARDVVLDVLHRLPEAQRVVDRLPLSGRVLDPGDRLSYGPQRVGGRVTAGPGARRLSPSLERPARRRDVNDDELPTTRSNVRRAW